MSARFSCLLTYASRGDYRYSRSLVDGRVNRYEVEGIQIAKTFTDEVIYSGSAFKDVVKVEQRRDGVKMRKATKQRDVAMAEAV